MRPSSSNPIASRHEVRPLSPPRIRTFGERNGQVLLATDRAVEAENYVGDIVNETERTQLANVPLDDGQLEGDVELLECLYIRQVRQTEIVPLGICRPATSVISPSRPEIAIARLLLGALFQQTFHACFDVAAKWRLDNRAVPRRESSSTTGVHPFICREQRIPTLGRRLLKDGQRLSGPPSAERNAGVMLVRAHDLVLASRLRRVTQMRCPP